MYIYKHTCQQLYLTVASFAVELNRGPGAKAISHTSMLRESSSTSSSLSRIHNPRAASSYVRHTTPHMTVQVRLSG